MADKETTSPAVPEPSTSAEQSTVIPTTTDAANEDVAKSESVPAAGTAANEDAPVTEDTPVEGAAKKESQPAAESAKDSAEASGKDAPTASAPPLSPFAEFATKLPDLVKEIGHDEMWGVKLATTQPVESHVPTQIVIQKFLNANDGDLSKGLEQFKSALTFRKEKKPLELMAKTFKASKFGDLGVVTFYPVKDSVVPEVFTWNLYGNVKERMDEVFVPLKEFMEFRIALQELGIKHLQLSEATTPITETDDPYKVIQVHDYKGVSFFRQNPNVRAASTEVIKQFALAYPELLKEKFFVNVPAVMGWVYGVMKLFVAEKTRKKFHPMANGANLAAEFQTPSGFDAKELPKEYGGEKGTGDGTLKGIEGEGVEVLKFE